jgi:hypothetical protein
MKHQGSTFAEKYQIFGRESKFCVIKVRLIFVPKSDIIDGTTSAVT